jgi:ATP-dependent DNA helicase RecQ
VAIHSGLSHKEIKRHLENASRGLYDFLYLAPERLKTDLFLGHLPHLDLSLVAVDEAHCISQWGHDFRPAYREIAEIREQLPNVPFIAVTATATPKVVVDIKEQLDLKNAAHYQASFKRSNLNWVVIEDAYDFRRMAQIVKQISGSIIIYAYSRFRTAEIADFLRKRGIKAMNYHAGLNAEEREKRQKLWMNNKYPVMVATNAFGMGVDKADVRAVIHMDLTNGPEEYYQEAGRAGRDGKPAYAILIHDENKQKEAEERLAQQFPSPEFCQEVYHALGQYFKIAYGSGEMATFSFDIKGFARAYELNSFKVYYALKHIEKSAWIQLSDSINRSSKIFIKISKDALYEMQVRNTQLDLFMKAILRMYEGVFIDYVKIDEGDIAKRLKIDKAEVKKYLKRLVELDVLEYEEAIEGTAITFLEARVQKRGFSLDKAIYNNSYQRTKNRWQAMNQYLNAEECRTKQLLQYFGEEVDEKCGKCDICLGSKKDQFQGQLKKKMMDKILQMLGRKKLTTRELTYHFSFNLEKRILSLLDEMEKEGLLSMDDDQKLRPSGE